MPRRSLILDPSTLTKLAVAGALAMALAACADAPDDEAADQSASSGSAPATSASASSETLAVTYPVTITSCGRATTVAAKPTHAITLNQGATEVALALGLQDQMAGTAYLDDQVSDQWQAAYESVPVLSKEYPSKEKFLAAQPDFAYSSYSSAFDAKAVGTQDELEGEGIPSYVSPFGCDDKSQRPPTTFDSVWDEVDGVATAFGVPERGTALREEQQGVLDTLEQLAVGSGKTIFWYDSGTKKPFVGAGQGSPELVIDAVGGTNIFADVEGGWADGNWEDVIAADPDVIVLADASWDHAQDKIDYLTKDPVLSQLRAVKAKAFITVPFSETTAGVRLVDGAQLVSDQLAALPAS